jgi:hypothetical protein
VVHNSLEKYLDSDWWALSSEELNQESNQKGVSVIIDDLQRWTVPALPFFAVPSALCVLVGVRWIKVRRRY